jgi:hypothetical protein
MQLRVPAACVDSLPHDSREARPRSTMGVEKMPARHRALQASYMYF